MAGNILFPSLSEDGWVDSSQKTADLMFSHFFIANYSQSYAFSGFVSSFPYILAVNHGNISAIISATRQGLTDYFSRIYQNVIVEVKEVDNPASPADAPLEIFVEFTDYLGKTYSLGKTVNSSSSTFSKIVAINNG